ncbi:MAG: hypothetical protein L6V88_10510 [Anaerotruncus sp.]|nr:MAG: hypothetical protein L6V88_10510 [Anaerotruncus sp.]
MIDLATSSATDKTIANYLHAYYMLCIYRGALTLAKAGLLSSDMFKLDYNLGHELASAAIAVLDSRFAFIEDKSRFGADSASMDEKRPCENDKRGRGIHNECVYHRVIARLDFSYL